MTGTFGSLNIAKTGLQYQQLVMDTAGSNISNVSTDGYVRRSVAGGEVATGAVSALWSTSNDHGTGVVAESVSRLTDQLADTRVRREHGTLSSLLTQQTALSNVETAINEPSDSGVSAALSDFSTSLQDLNNSPDSAAASNALAKAQSLVAAIHSQAQSISDEDGELRTSASSDVDAVNADAQQLAGLNKSIVVGQASGSDVNSLLDQRDQIALDLANRAGAVSVQQPDGTFTVTVGNAVLVQGTEAGSLAFASPAPTAPNPLTFQVTTPGSDATTVPVTLDSGNLGGDAAAVTSLQTYSDKLDGVVNTLVTNVNAAQANGWDLTGVKGTDFFSGTTAATIAVALTSGTQIAASSAASTTYVDGKLVPNLDGGNANKLAAAVDVNDQYQAAVTTLGSQISGLNSQVTTQQAVATQADDAREQQTGVSIDEETINMTAAQRAYEAASRVLTVMDSMLDTLINHTGVTS